MNKKTKTRKGFVHLYNPKVEGLGTYDVHYINAYKKVNNLNNNLIKNDDERYVA